MDRQLADQSNVLSTPLLTLSLSRQRELLLFGLLAGLGTAASYLSVNIPYTEVYIDGRLAFGFMGFALLRRWWSALLLAGLLSLTGFHQVPVTTYLPANMLYLVPCLITIRLVHTHLLSRSRQIVLYGAGWLLLVLACYQLFATPLLWAVWAMLRERPVWPTVLAGWQEQPFLVESFLVGIVSALGMVVVRSHQALRRSRRELATTLDSIGDGVIATDGQGRVTRMNPVAQALTGWPLEEAWGRYLEEVLCLVNAQTGQPAENPVDRVLREGVVVGLANHTCLIARDGTERHIADSAAPIREADGRLTGTVLVFRDVTHEHEARAALRQSEQYQQALIQASPLAIISLDAGGQVLTWNEAAEQMFGWRAVETVGRPMLTLPAGQQEKFDSLCRRVMAGESFANLELVHCRKDGSLIEVSLFTAPIRDGEGRPSAIMAVLEEITERKLRQKMSQVRMRLLEFAAEHTLEELLTKTLDEIGQLVKSPIGFYHFVQADQKTLSLQAWSTQTLEQFCQTEGAGLHYDVDEAGVWVDCIYQRRPVVHNDYAALPHRKGMPEGHTTVIRELVVPIFRDNRIVAVLGVGNKPQDYTAHDVEIVSYLADVAWEIAQHKRAEEELRQSHARFQAFFENPAVGMVIWDTQDPVRYMAINETLARLNRVPAAEHIDRTIAEVLNPEVEQENMPLIRDVVRRRQPRFLESSGISPDGREVHYQAHYFPLMREDGTVVAVGGVVLDQSQRKRAEADRKRLMAAIEQASEIIVITDPMGTIQYVNPAFTQATGYARQEALGQTLRLLKSGEHDRSFYAELWETISSGKRWEGRFVNRRKNGTTYIEEATISPVRDKAGNVANYVAVKRDITEQLRLNEEKAELAAQLNHAQKMESVGRLAGGVAHDLNNLLTPILGYGELLLDDFGQDDVRKGDVEKIVQAAGRARDLVRQLLAFSRKQVLAFAPVDLNLVLNRFEKLLRRTIREDVTIDLILDSSIPLIKGDAGQLERVIMNLAVNAQDAMPDGGNLTLQTAVVELDRTYVAAHQDLKPGRYVMLGVNDSGCGMDVWTREHLFEPFFTTKEKGTGLGLATVYGIVKQHGGHIWVYSEPGHGTIFKIYLPASEDPGEQEETPSLEISSDWSGTETILLVEDDEQVRNLSHTILKRQGYTVLTAKNGREALAAADRHDGPLHLLLTDVVMPEMNGKELFSRISKQFPDMRVLYMSGYTDDVIGHHGVLDEGVDFIQKPFSVQFLIARVWKVLSQD